MEEGFKSKHNLKFEVSKWMADDFLRFRVGTCDGLWRSTKNSFDILAILNSEPGNGHLDDVFEWFEQSCRRDGKKLMVLEIWNQSFKQHLINKRGFKRKGPYNLQKTFKPNTK
jgi:hypothetical protein